MEDLTFILAMTVFFLACLGLVQFCGRLRRFQ